METGAHGSDHNTEFQLEDGDLVESSPNGWTNEKHMLYLSSMEASFVNRLYNNNDYDSSELLGWSDRKPKINSTSNQSLNGQFKVLREGSWKILGYGKNSDSIEPAIQTESGCSTNLLSSPWIQRLRVPSSTRNDARVHQTDDCESEVSDQNFIDMEIEGVAELTRPVKRQRKRPSF